MIELLIFIILAIVVVAVLFIAVDYIAGAAGAKVDGRLWMLLKGLIVLAALLYVLQRQGVV